MLVKKLKADLIHAHCEASALYGSLAGRMSRVPVVGTVHRSILSHYTPNFSNRLYYHFPTRIIAVSHERKKRLMEQLGIPEKKITVLHWGINPVPAIELNDKSNIKSKLSLPDCQIILSLGHLGSIKGHDDSIAALAKIKPEFPNVKLYIGGDGTQADYRRLSLLVERLELQDSVTLLGQIINPIEWIIASDIFLQPSREEAFGLVFLEAGACKKPTIATRVGGIPEIIEDGVTGYLVETHQPDSIAEKLVSLLSDEKKAIAMGNRAYTRIMSKFLLSTQIDKLEKFLGQQI